MTADLVENAATTYKEHHAEKIYVPKKTACDADGDSNADATLHIFGNDTSCHIIDTWDPKLNDTLNGNKQYYNLIPSAYWPSTFRANATDGVHDGNKDRMEIDPSYHLKPKEYPPAVARRTVLLGPPLQLALIGVEGRRRLRRARRW